MRAQRRSRRRNPKLHRGRQVPWPRAVSPPESSFCRACRKLPREQIFDALSIEQTQTGSLELSRLQSRDAFADTGWDGAKPFLDLAHQQRQLSFDPALGALLPDQWSKIVVIPDVFLNRHFPRLPFGLGSQLPQARDNQQLCQRLVALVG